MRPTPENVKDARLKAGMTQELAGKVLNRHNREWRRWESGDAGMQEWAWELFLLKTGQHPTLRLEPKA